MIQSLKSQRWTWCLLLAALVALPLAGCGGEEPEPMESELEPATGFMMGKFKVSGDMSVAMKLQRVV